MKNLDKLTVRELDNELTYHQCSAVVTKYAHMRTKAYALERENKRLDKLNDELDESASNRQLKIYALEKENKALRLVLEQTNIDLEMNDIEILPYTLERIKKALDGILKGEK